MGAQNGKAGLPKRLSGETSKGDQTLSWRFLMTPPKIFFSPSGLHPDLKPVFGETKTANAQVSSWPVIVHLMYLHPFGVSHEMEYPEGADMKPPGGFLSLWRFSCC